MGGRPDRTLTARLRSAQILVVAAAGNAAKDNCASTYNKTTTKDKLLVGATNQSDALWVDSNYGACVHVQVPSPSRHPRLWV